MKQMILWREEEQVEAEAEAEAEKDKDEESEWKTEWWMLMERKKARAMALMGRVLKVSLFLFLIWECFRAFHFVSLHMKSQCAAASFINLPLDHRDGVVYSLY